MPGDSCLRYSILKQGYSSRSLESLSRTFTLSSSKFRKWKRIWTILNIISNTLSLSKWWFNCLPKINSCRCQEITVAGGCLKGYAKTRLVAFGKVTISWLLGRRQMIFTHIRLAEGRGLLYLWSHTCNYSVLLSCRSTSWNRVNGKLLTWWLPSSHFRFTKALRKYYTSFLA